MPKEFDSAKRYIKAATDNIKSQGTVKELYKAIHGREGDKYEIQILTNRLNANRSNPGADILGLCVENLPELHDMKLSEFFGIEKSE
ncbi:hypothetical protein CJ419_09595 [Vibrio navarrensis]|nr:hypothetical protein [Vibrio navarrensis]